MTDYTLPHFGNLAIGNLEEYYHVTIDFQGNEVEIDLNFENKTIDVETMGKVKNFIENLEELNQLNTTYILDDYNDENGDTVKFYLEHHLDVVDKDVLSDLINFNDTTTNPEKQLFAKLKLVRVGLYPDSGNNFAIFDYSIGKNITNYLVVINTDENGQLDYLTMES
jgi:hypothetical protein